MMVDPAALREALALVRSTSRTYSVNEMHQANKLIDAAAREFLRLMETAEGQPRRFVTPEEHQAQWDAGWPDFHPEAYCQRCFGRNIKSWYVDGPLWMQAVDRGTEILCPQCFTELYADATGDWQTWEIRPAQRPDDDLTTAIRAILEGNPHAHNAYLAHRIAIEIADPGGNDGDTKGERHD